MRNCHRQQHERSDQLQQVITKRYLPIGCHRRSERPARSEPLRLELHATVGVVDRCDSLRDRSRDSGRSPHAVRRRGRRRRKRREIRRPDSSPKRVLSTAGRPTRSQVRRNRNSRDIPRVSATSVPCGHRRLSGPRRRRCGSEVGVGDSVVRAEVVEPIGQKVEVEVPGRGRTPTRRRRSSRRTRVRR